MTCLAFERDRVFAREELIERFWPEIDPERGRANLATALWAVRRALEPDADAIVRATRTAICFAGDVTVDAAAFERDVRATDSPRRAAALRAYRGDFLPEHTDPWSAAQRERLGMLYEGALQAGARETRDPELAWKAIERDPYAEDAYAVLIDHALQLGNRTAARGFLTRWKAALDELGTQPGPAFSERVRATEATADAVDASPLPASLSSFVGRGAETARVEAALRDARLVTLTGPGGAGKTRLALHVARSNPQAFPGGLSFVDLASVAPEHVGEALAAGFGCDPRDANAVTATARMLAASDVPRLAVIDNCEAVIEPVAAALDELLSATTRACFLVTSREPLRLRGERIVAVPPLPPADATALFAARAREAGVTIENDGPTRAAITAICARLDGLPLAIELAAARASVAPLAEYERWLADRFDVLGATRRGGRTAHRTLRALYDDGFARLDAQEQMVFRRMASVAAPWNADALAVACSDENSGRSSALAALWRLVDKSFVVSEAEGDRARYRLLESSRAYARERLDAAGDAETALNRHLAFYVAAAERVEHLFVRDGDRAWDMPARALAADHAHIADALRFAFRSRARIDAALELITGIRRVWIRFGPHAEASRLLREALAAVPPDLDTLRRGALWGALGDVEVTRGAYRAGADAAEEAVRLLAGHDGTMLARSYVQLLNALQNLGDPRAAEVTPLAIAAARSASDDGCTWYLLLNEANDRVNGDGDGDGELDAAEARLAEALVIAERLERPLLVAATRACAAKLAGRRGRFAHARAETMSAISAYRALRAEPYVANALVQLAWFARACGDVHEARAAAAEAFSLASRTEFETVSIMALDEFGAASIALDDDASAAFLRGYRDGLTLRAFVRTPPEHLARHAGAGERLRAELPAAYERGQRATLDDVVSLMTPSRIAV